MLFSLWRSTAQNASFYRLSTAEGLSDNRVQSVVRDKNGILWVATSEGLNSFDGNRITAYYKKQYPQIPVNTIDRLIADPENRIWIQTPSHYLTMLDEKRKFHRFNVGDTTDQTMVNMILFSPSRGVFALKGNDHYFPDGITSGRFIKTNLKFDTIFNKGWRYVYSLHGDKFGFYIGTRLVVVDYNTESVLLDMELPGINGMSYINDDEILAFRLDGSFIYRISISQRKIIRKYMDIKDQYGNKISGNLRNYARIDDRRFVLTTLFSGFYIFDSDKGTVQIYQHDPIDPRSLGGNNTFRAKYDTSGYLFITTQTSGVHFLNLNQSQIQSKSYFIDKNNEVFDGYVESVTTDQKGVIWMGAQDRLIRWEKGQKFAEYIPCVLRDGTNLKGVETIRIVSIDQNRNIWVGTTRHGILILDPMYRTVRQINISSESPIPSNWINAVFRDSEARIWVGTARGLCTVNPVTYEVTLFKDHPVLSPLSNIHITLVWEDKAGKLWIGSQKGLWMYDVCYDTLTHYNRRGGLMDNTIHSVCQDRHQNTYVATSGGLTIISTDGKIQNYDRTNGLMNDRCEDVMMDSNGYIWVGNLNCILRFDPSLGKFVVFEDGFGFAHGGFRMRTAYQTPEGEMYWGTDKGIYWFYPDAVAIHDIVLHPIINSLQYADTTLLFTAEASVMLRHDISGLIFSFSSGELSGLSKTKFLYKLEGADEDWQQPASQGYAFYNKIPSGSYKFMLKASRDGINWFEAPYTVNLDIAYPWWRQSWFRIVALICFISVGYFIFTYYQQRQIDNRIRTMLEYFAGESHDYVTVDELLWDICRNVIINFNFEDCVIYLLDDEKNILVQKAAAGAKSISPYKIVNPIEIPLGKGIVGYVAVSGIGEIVNDTEKDDRYIVDDKSRKSEISIPLIHDGKVIGVIDSEHSQKNYFTETHFKNLRTLSSLCSAKISKAMALDAMRKTQLEMTELKLKMAESRFSNLRLQMNPHFLFNSLSAIQHLIVSQQTSKAYKYLTVFSNFLRSLLNHADKNFISLEAEVKILNMYVSLESLRFDSKFECTITVDDSLDTGEVFIPTLIIQPFAENAIWHGLLHKEGEKKLSIRFSLKDEDYIECDIEDNGIGREQANVYSQNNLSSRVHESKGIQIIEERLQLLAQKSGKDSQLQILDLIASDNTPAGTKVMIILPIYNPEEV